MSSPLRLRDRDHLEQLLADSGDQPFLLFKHSETCGTSLAAFEELHAYLSDSESALPCMLVVVQDQRELSSHVAQRLGVRHESPQAILVQAGRSVWSGSHHSLTSQALSKVTRQFSSVVRA